MKKIEIGCWYYVYSPINGDFNKKTGKGQEIRICFAESYNPIIEKYKVQMLTKKDIENANWFYIRKNAQKIQGRDYYRVNIN